MKRSYFGFLLLGALLLGGLFSSRAMVRRHEPLGQRLEQAADYALAEDWAKAQSLTRQVRQQWEENWNTTACFADHAPMEQIDGLLAQLEVYGEQKEAAAFAAVCMELSRNVGAVGEAHSLSWWNLL